MKITVTDACQGHGRCLMSDTDMLEPDDLGFVSAAGDGTVPDNERETMLLAAANCPERAIIVEGE
jgi:ferredoxin